MNEIDSKLDKQNEAIQQNEKDRLRTEIVNFATQIRVYKYEAFEALDFEHIANVYDKYVKLGGNSYAHSEYEFIKDQKAKYDAMLVEQQEGDKND